MKKYLTLLITILLISCTGAKNKSLDMVFPFYNKHNPPAANKATIKYLEAFEDKQWGLVIVEEGLVRTKRYLSIVPLHTRSFHNKSKRLSVIENSVALSEDDFKSILDMLDEVQSWGSKNDDASVYDLILENNPNALWITALSYRGTIKYELVFSAKVDEIFHAIERKERYEYENGPDIFSMLSELDINNMGHIVYTKQEELAAIKSYFLNAKAEIDKLGGFQGV